MPLIDLATFEKIQQRLDGTVYAPARKDLGDFFALRVFVTCADCERPLYPSQSRRRDGGLFAHYCCHTKGCASFGKSIRRDKLEGDFEALLKAMRPTKGLPTLVREMFLHAWEQRRAQIAEMQGALRRNVTSVEKQIDGFLDTISDAGSTTAVRAYERRIERLEHDKLKMQDQLATVGTPKETPNATLEPALQFFSNSWKVWASGRSDLRRLVLRLEFSEQLACCRNTGPRTPKTSLPFSM
ncbi:MAG: zinc ribbon domain-containing protein [Pseudomonadota bacterium]